MSKFIGTKSNQIVKTELSSPIPAPKSQSRTTLSKPTSQNIHNINLFYHIKKYIYFVITSQAQPEFHETMIRTCLVPWNWL